MRLSATICFCFTRKASFEVKVDSFRKYYGVGGTWLGIVGTTVAGCQLAQFGRVCDWILYYQYNNALLWVAKFGNNLTKVFFNYLTRPVQIPQDRRSAYEEFVNESLKEPLSTYNQLKKIIMRRKKEENARRKCKIIWFKLFLTSSRHRYYDQY